MENLDGGLGQVDNQPAGGENVADNAPAEPSVIEVDENALIKPKGYDKPIKFGEYGRNFQAQWTREAQKRAALEKQLAERDARLKQIESERAQAQRQPQQGNADVFAQLRQLPYLTGEDAVGVVQSIARQIQDRDRILVGTLEALKQQQAIVNQLYNNHNTVSFDAKIDRWLKENNWSPELRELAKEVYLAYEGDDLDYEFPRIFQSRVQQMRKAFEAERAAQVSAAKRPAFVPGRGGDAKPSKPLEFKGGESAKDIADKMWDLFHESGT